MRGPKFTPPKPVIEQNAKTKNGILPYSFLSVLFFVIGFMVFDLTFTIGVLPQDWFGPISPPSLLYGLPISLSLFSLSFILARRSRKKTQVSTDFSAFWLKR